MASLINMPFTFNREEVKDLSKVIGERFYNHPAISELHDIEQGVKYDTQILFAQRLGLLSKRITGCTPASASGLTFSEKTWTPKDFSFRLEHCSADVNVQNKLLRQFQKMNPDFYNILEGMGMSAIGQFLVGYVEDALIEDIFYKIWWSDTTAETIANSGVFDNTFDIDKINGIDGLWKQIEVAIPSGDANHVNIAKNEAASYVLQTLAANEAETILKSMYAKADSRLLTDPELKFMVSRSLYENYMETLETRQGNGGITQYGEDGNPILKFRGITIVNMGNLWDVFIKDNMDNGTKLNNPHRALLTVKANIPIATVNENDLSSLNPFFAPYQNLNVIDAAFNLDVKLLEKYLAIAAY
jgi:hypothetical protein